MAKQRYVPDLNNIKDPEIREWLQRHLDRAHDLWPEDYQSRIEQLELTWPYLTGSWPIVDIAELQMITVSFRDSCAPRQAPYELSDVQYWVYGDVEYPYVYTESTDSWAIQSFSTSGGFPFAFAGAGSDDGSGKLMLVEDSSGETWFSNDNGNYWQQKADYGGRMAPTGGEGGVLYSRGNWYIWGRDGGTNSARLWKSTNDGDSWTLIKSDYVTNEVQHCAYKRDDDYLCFVSVLCASTTPGCGVPKIAITTDQGQSFTEVTMASDIVDPRYPTADVRLTQRIELAYDDVHNKWFMGGRQSSGSGYGHILKQDGPDIGGWSHTGQGGVGYYGAATYEGNVLFVDESENVTRTPDGGDSWVTENPGGGQVAFNTVISVPGKGVYISARDRLHLWNPATGYTVAYEGRFWGGKFRGAVLLADNQADDQYYPPECFQFGVLCHLWGGSSSEQLFTSPIGQDFVWTQQPNAASQRQAAGYGPDYDSNGNLLGLEFVSSGVARGIYWADGSTAWVQRTATVPIDANYSNIHFDPETQRFYAIGPGYFTSEVKTYWSDDAGVSWNFVSNQSYSGSAPLGGKMVARDPNYWVYQVANQNTTTYFFVSTNKGESWVQKTVDTSLVFPIYRPTVRQLGGFDFCDVNRRWFWSAKPSSGSNYGGILRSTGEDISGTGWQFTLEFHCGSDGEGIRCHNGYVLAASDAGSRWTGDNGNSWTNSTSSITGRRGTHSMSKGTRIGIAVGTKGRMEFFKEGVFNDQYDEMVAACDCTSFGTNMYWRSVTVIDKDSKRQQ